MEYKARLNDNATSGFDANTNLAELTYSNSPSTVDDSKKDKTYHYTFDIDGDISGTLGKYGKEIIKVGVDASTGEFITAEEVSDLGSVEGKLENVEFTLYKEDGMTVVQGPINTDSNGLMKFSKLDAGKYVLKETNAPAGYVLNNTAIPVEITAKLMDDGKLESYTVKINDEATSTYKATYNGENQLVAVNDQTGNQSAVIKNYKPGALPSTGGMGTYIFMIIGGALIALAAVLYIRSRKKHVA